MKFLFSLLIFLSDSLNSVFENQTSEKILLEKGMDGSPINAHKYEAATMKKALALIFLLLFPISAFSQNDGEEISIGKYRAVPSKVLSENRRILVHLPLGYESTKLNYPVVYHLYGDYVMTYFVEAVFVLDRLHSANKMPQVILIGVDNTDRCRDLRPIGCDGSPGGIENFIRYFKEELMVLVQLTVVI